MGKCLCPGGLYEKWHRWRLVEGGTGKADRLYCLDCRQSWNTRARYAKIMRRHKVRKQSGLSDQDILHLLAVREIVVDCQAAKVFSNRRKEPREISQVVREHKEGASRGTYRFVKICAYGKQKKIALHRLVWMAHTMQLVPDGHDIDHISNQGDDSIKNLRCITAAENRATRCNGGGDEF